MGCSRKVKDAGKGNALCDSYGGGEIEGRRLWHP